MRNSPFMGRARQNHGARSGIVRHVDQLGRIVIPSEIRKRFGLATRDPVEISMAGDEIVLSRPQTACIFCGRNEPLVEYRGRPVCRDCVDELAAA
jgi:transcriptional pleiotropic regulator of transition state genes